MTAKKAAAAAAAPRQPKPDARVGVSRVRAQAAAVRLPNGGGSDRVVHNRGGSGHDANDDLLAAYLHDIETRVGDRLLTREEERALGRQWRDARDEEARRELVLCNLRLVVAIARTYYTRELTLLDLIGAGNAGLLVAVGKYDPDEPRALTSGARFASYAGWWIRQSIARSIAMYDAAVPLPGREWENASKLRRAEARLAVELGREPSAAETQIAAGVPAASARSIAIGRATRHIASLDAPLPGYANDDPDPRTLYDEIADGEGSHADAAEQDFTDAIAEADEHGWLLATVARELTSRERLVIDLRFGLSRGTGRDVGGYRERTLAEVGQQLGVSRERVRQIEKRAMAKLRAAAGVEVSDVGADPGDGDDTDEEASRDVTNGHERVTNAAELARHVTSASGAA